MSETTDQMSLLDAIGIPASEETARKPKKDARPDAARPRAKTSAKRKPSAAKAPDASDDAPERTGDVAASTEPANEPAAFGQPVGDSAMNAAGTDPLSLDRFLCFALYSANHAMHGVYKPLLKEVGLTYPQFLAMTVLWETNNVPVGAITSKLQLDTNTLTPLLKRLEAMGLVTRTRNIKDERQVILKLTRKGRALQKKTEHFGSCLFSASGLQAEDVMDLQTRIMKLRDNLRDAGQD